MPVSSASLACVRCLLRRAARTRVDETALRASPPNMTAKSYSRASRARLSACEHPLTERLNAVGEQRPHHATPRDCFTNVHRNQPQQADRPDQNKLQGIPDAPPRVPDRLTRELLVYFKMKIPSGASDRINSPGAAYTLTDHPESGEYWPRCQSENRCMSRRPVCPTASFWSCGPPRLWLDVATTKMPPGFSRALTWAKA